MKPVLSRAKVLAPHPVAVQEHEAPMPTPAPRAVEWRPAWHEVEPREAHWRPAASIAEALRAARRLDINDLAGLELRDAETRRPLVTTPANEEAP